MAAELTTTRLEADTHLLLDQPLLRLPPELLRKTLKSAQRHIEITNKALTTTLPAAAKNSNEALAALDATLAKAQTLKRKLEALHAEERAVHRQQRARIAHLEALHRVESLADVSYDIWAHTRLDRLVVDYLLRQGWINSARQLAAEQNISDLVDVGVFEECGRIERSLRNGEVKEALGWCAENKQALRKMESSLELELRLQQFIELARSGDISQQLEAVAHARKHLVGGLDIEFGLRAGGLLAQPPDTLVEPYRTMYSRQTRYPTLASLFLQTHHSLLALPPHPLLHTALSAGLSALKTPACHSQHRLSPHPQTTSLTSPLTPSTTTGGSICPICSPELNELARSVPYAHHTKSFIEEDPVVLPNGRVFGRERLRLLGEKLGVREGRVRDPTVGGQEWGLEELGRVFIT